MNRGTSKKLYAKGSYKEKSPWNNDFSSDQNIITRIYAGNISNEGNKDCLYFSGFTEANDFSNQNYERFIYNPNRSYKLLNENIIVLKALSKIVEEIDRAKYILKLKKGWDGDDAVTIKKKTWKRMAEFLINSTTKIYEQYYSVVIQTPEINPCPDGSIDLSWRTSSARLLINTREQNKELMAFYYGDLKDGKSPIKGSFPIESNCDYLLIWMKQYLI